jgi:putative transposase
VDPQMVAWAGNWREAAEDVLTSREFPGEHWTQIHSTNLVERVNRELARRCDVAGILATPHAVLRLVGAVPEEIHEEWLVTRRSFSSRSMHHLLSSGQEGTEPPESG